MSATGRGAPAQSATADREIVISRVISAPRELVFEAFTEVRHLSRWWGPEGFTTTTRSFEFRVGGEWDFVMHGPDGTDYQEWISFTEIAPPERIALLRLDTDFYESTKAEMEILYPRLSRGGVLIVDDYGEWAGARKAVDEYFAGQPVWLHYVTHTVRLMIKP